MKIALVATYAHPLALGLRYVSAFLKARGHDVRMLFMANKRDTAKADFPPALLAELADRVRDADLVGLSLMTNTFHRARVLTESLRAAGIRAPIIWGGIHPTIAPEESLEAADIVCIGEGEHTMAELADTLQAGRDPTRIEGLWFRRNGTVIRNEVRPLAEDLDALPLPDYELANQHYVAQGDRFVAARPDILRGVLDRYRIQTTRGCPCRCAFCNNAAFQRIYRGKGRWVRMRSNESILGELETRMREFPTINAVNIVDDLFLIRGEQQIEEFADGYARRIHLPLQFDAFPTTISAAKIRSLRRLPIALVSMGIQSGSENTLYDIYDRRTPLERVARSIDLLADNRLPAEYHYIVNNPFEPDANVIETIRFAARHHRGPAIVRVFPLALYPSTPLHDRAVAEGVLAGRHRAEYEHAYGSKYHVVADTYLTILLRAVLWMKGAGLSARTVEAFAAAATSRPARAVFDHRWFPYAAYGFFRIGHFISRRIIQQCILRPIAALRGRRRPALRPASA